LESDGGRLAGTVRPGTVRRAGLFRRLLKNHCLSTVAVW
jgi:hypothetical protein